MNIYVGNLPFSTSENELSELFGEHGQVISAKIIIDRMTGRSKGFGFVEMESDDEAKAAIEALDQKEFQGRTLKVNEARPREERPRRNFY
jgi:RNA recognition motif-containing protein